MAEHSAPSLPHKLGIRADHTVVTLGSPDDFVEGLGPLPEGTALIREARRPADIVIAFATAVEEITTLFEEAMTLIPADGAVWVAWPKKASGVATDLDGNTLRDLFLPTGMVDTKVCAIDDTWTALRFVVRKEHRETWPR